MCVCVCLCVCVCVCVCVCACDSLYKLTLHLKMFLIARCVTLANAQGGGGVAKGWWGVNVLHHNGWFTLAHVYSLWWLDGWRVMQGVYCIIYRLSFSTSPTQNVEDDKIPNKGKQSKFVVQYFAFLNTFWAGPVEKNHPIVHIHCLHIYVPRITCVEA